MDYVGFGPDTLDSKESFFKEKLLMGYPANGRSKLLSYKYPASQANIKQSAPTGFSAEMPNPD